MLHSVSEQLAYDHLADLRRDATAHSRSASRADRAGGTRARAAHAHGLRLSFRSASTAVGCEA